jgi:hypothetical protein
VSSNVPAEETLQEGVLPERVQEALGELVGAAKEGLLALSVGATLCSTPGARPPADQGPDEPGMAGDRL